jgi:glucose-6-phosphate 1-dehydrogenase
MTEVTTLESDAFVFFGATGDLAFRQIFLALQALIRRGHVEMPIIGAAKSEMDVGALRARAHASLEQHGGVDPRAFATLAAHLQYVNGDYHNSETFRQLRTAPGAARRPLYYFAIPPELFATLAEGLAGSDSHHGVRVVVEKPFGPRPRLRPGPEPNAASVLSRVSDLPDRSLFGEGARSEPRVLSLRQLGPRADLEPPIHRERAGDHG